MACIRRVPLVCRSCPTSSKQPRAGTVLGQGRAMTGVPGWPVAFRGTDAVAAGLVTKDLLRGRHYLRMFPDTYVRTPVCLPDLALRSHAAYRYVAGRGVLA